MRGLSLPAIYKHIKVLEAAGMIMRKKVGQTNFLALNRKSMDSLQEWLNQYHAIWGSDQESLANYAQNMSEYIKEKK